MKIINQYIVKYNMGYAYLSEVPGNAEGEANRFFIDYAKVVDGVWKKLIQELNAEEAASLIIV